jgi:hypothetical protein
MAKIESLPLNVVLNLTRQKIMSACGTTNVEIIGVGYASKYEDDDYIDDYPLLVNALVIGAKGAEDSGLHPWLMVWNENECDFHTLMRLDQKESNNKGDHH